MGSAFVVRMDGIADLQRRGAPQHLMGTPMRNLLTKSALIAKAESQARTPRDMAHLQRSQTHAVDGAAIPSWAQIGTNVPYAVFVHQGTRPHFPPPAALAGWASRHGANPFAVARAISIHGTKPQPFMREGAEAARPKIGGLEKGFVAEVEQLWRTG